MNKLYSIIAEIIRVPENNISDDLSMQNTESWDSLKHMELIVSIEKSYNMSLSADEIVKMINVGAIKQIIESNGIV